MKRSEMNVLVVLNHEGRNDLRLVVRLHTEPLRRRVSALMSEEKERDAFDLILSRGMVQEYVPSGSKLSSRPDWTLIEDLL